MLTKLLVPVDGSSHSTRAVEMAIELARHHEASVFLLHVIRDLSLPREILDMISAGEVTASRTQILQDSAEIILNNAREKINAAGLSDVESEFIFGDPTSKILEYAEQKGVDLIILGQRGLAPHEGLLGGIARKILNMTTISCLIVA